MFESLFFIIVNFLPLLILRISENLPRAECGKRMIIPQISGIMGDKWANLGTFGVAEMGNNGLKIGFIAQWRNLGHNLHG